MSDPIYITAIFRVALAHADKLEREMRNCVKQSRQEAGCLRYFIYRDIENPGLFSSNETWASPMAFDAHNASPHFQRLAALLKELNVASEILKVAPIEPHP